MDNELHAGPASQEDLRVLRRVDLSTGSTDDGADEVAGFGVVVDVETTGLDPDTDVVFELAARRFAYDADHVITRLDRPYVWRRDPGRPLSPEIVKLTGVTDADLAGRSIDSEEASRVIGSAAVRIAHNARFDRPFVEDLLPGASGLPWACSIEDVGWTRLGFESAKLGWILGQCGYFHDAHGAAADVDATIQILRHEVESGRTALSVLMENASASGWIVHAVGAPFGAKDRLRARGYRWNPLRRVWWAEIRDRMVEEAWLREHVYRVSASRRLPAGFQPIDWASRFGR